MIGSLLLASINWFRVLNAFARCWAYCTWESSPNQQNHTVEREKCTREKHEQLNTLMKEKHGKKAEKINNLSQLPLHEILKHKNIALLESFFVFLSSVFDDYNTWTTFIWRNASFHLKPSLIDQWILWREMKSISVQVTSVYFFSIFFFLPDLLSEYISFWQVSWIIADVHSKYEWKIQENRNSYFTENSLCANYFGNHLTMRMLTMMLNKYKFTTDSSNQVSCASTP